MLYSDAAYGQKQTWHAEPSNLKIYCFTPHKSGTDTGSVRDYWTRTRILRSKVVGVGVVVPRKVPLGLIRT